MELLTIATDWKVRQDRYGGKWRVYSKELKVTLDDKFRDEKTALSRASILNAMHKSWMERENE